MTKGLTVKYIGKDHISSQFSRCSECGKLTLLNTYTTLRVLHLGRLPLVPTGRFRMIDQCPHCGKQERVAEKHYARQRKAALGDMVDVILETPDNPETCLQAMRTLISFNEMRWFQDLRRVQGLVFSHNMQVQLQIAMGLCRFGQYEDAIQYCEKAIELGAGAPAEELLRFCKSLTDIRYRKQKVEELQVHPESALKAFLPMAAGAGALATAVLVFGVSALLNHPAWIVNGTLNTYTFELDGQRYTMAAAEYRRIKLRYGRHRLSFNEDPVFEFTDSESGIGRLFNRSAQIINPDALALLSTEQGGESWYFGEKIYSLPAKGHTKPFRLLRPDHHGAMVEKLNTTGIPDAAARYARRVLRLDPHTAEARSLLDLATCGLPERDALDLLAIGKKEIPPLLPWHIHYQDYMRLHQPDFNLVSEYRSLCKSHENTPEFLYLLGRVVPSDETAKNLFLRSELGKSCNGFGFHAIASDLFQQGRFSEALAFSEKALARNPDQEEFEALNLQLHLALKDYRALLNHVAQQQERSGPLPQLISSQVLYLTLLGDHLEADALAQRFSEEQAAVLSPNWLALVNAQRYYATGNIRDYLACLKDADDPLSTFEKLLYSDQIDQANDYIQRSGKGHFIEHLLLYCLASQQDRTELASKNLRAAIKQAKNSTLAHQAAANLLSARHTPSLKTVERLELPPKEKALICTALGFRFSENRTVFFKLAERYNFTPEYPQRQLRRCWGKDILSYSKLANGS